MTDLIFRHLQVIYILFTEKGEAFTRFEVIRHRNRVRIRRRVRGVSPDGKKSKHPVVLVLAGRGIVSKQYPAGSEAARRITEHPEEFLCAAETLPGGEQRITFLRREAYDGAMERLNAGKWPIIETRIDPGGDPQAEVFAAGREFFAEGISARTLLRPSERSNTLLSMLAGRLFLPVLGIVLVFLTANYLIGRKLQRQADEQNRILSTLQQSAAAHDRQQGERDQLRSLMLPAAGRPYARIADRIAEVLPPDIRLTELSMSPIEKMQENKPLEADPGRIVIRGESASAAPVTQLTDTLRSLENTGSVQLISLNRGREGRYSFQIDLRR